MAGAKTNVTAMTTSDSPAASAGAQETIGFGHGKVILLGEHTVVYGHPAIAAGLPIGVRARVRPGRGQVSAPDWQLDLVMGDGSDVGTALEKLTESLGADPRALDVTLETEIPARAGLGSSAAMAVAVARAVAPWVGATNDAGAIEAAVAAAETVFHGTPSGVDAAAASHGGVGVFIKGQGWSPANVRQPIKLCLGLSGRPRRTSDLVESLALLARRMPVARKVIDVLGDVSRAGLEALALGDIDSLGRLFDVAHGLLAGLRLSTPELDRLVHGARAAGALGAKLTGAGGGGAVIALAPSHRQDVLDRWKTDGFDGMVATVGSGPVATTAAPGAAPGKTTVTP
jgi:mevalonate kinase